MEVELGGVDARVGVFVVCGDEVGAAGEEGAAGPVAGGGGGVDVDIVSSVGEG